ncbi:MAG: hypothetical protein OXC54_03200 [Rhodospirillaceae bacterium]|nr:hypothetical protein [Rhodospirillaceae bacterium]MCY4237047.1 hypothetical protein [Rhodospirillaceae bacterium]MCY4310309.1 hypothetical protein [Rhodospirillaceae bacterium]
MHQARRATVFTATKRAERDRPIALRTMKLKAVLHQIDPDHAHLFQGRAFPLLAFTTLPA